MPHAIRMTVGEPPVGQWFLRPTGEGEDWKLTFHYPGIAKQRLEGAGWENASYTFVGTISDVAQYIWNKHQSEVANAQSYIDRLGPNHMLHIKGRRPVPVKRMMTEEINNWNKTKKEFLIYISRLMSAVFIHSEWPRVTIPPWPWDPDIEVVIHEVEDKTLRKKERCS